MRPWDGAGCQNRRPFIFQCVFYILGRRYIEPCKSFIQHNCCTFLVCRQICCSSKMLFSMGFQLQVKNRVQFQKQSDSDRLRSDHVILIGRSHSTNVNTNRHIASRKYETKQFIAYWIVIQIIDLGSLEMKLCDRGCNKRHHSGDIYWWRYNGRRGNVIYMCRFESIKVSVQYTHMVLFIIWCGLDMSCFTSMCVCVVNFLTYFTSC